MGNNITERIKVKIFDLDGNFIEKFNSIHQLRVMYIWGKCSSKNLENLRNNKLVKWHDCFVGKTSAFPKNKINPLTCEHIMILNKMKKYKNKNQLISIIKKRMDEIIVIDESCRFLSSHKGTIEKLSKKENVSEGTIKSSLNRTPIYLKSGRLGVDSKNRKYYVYLTDLVKVLKIK